MPHFPRVIAAIRAASGLMAVCLPALEMLQTVHVRLKNEASREVIELIVSLIRTLDGMAPRSVLFYSHQVLARWYLSNSLEIRSEMLEGVCQELREVRPSSQGPQGPVGDDAGLEDTSFFGEGTIDLLMRCTSSKVGLGLRSVLELGIMMA